MLIFSGNNILFVRGNTITPLVSSGTALLSNGMFRVIPYQDPAVTGATNFLDVQHPGFWLFTNIQLLKYNPKDWVWNVQTSLQQFYNLQRIE